mmetsp:Transcript_37268/g.116530  ORF Transcript_37268/g.116530 Transcript_37268/m.116530 type:complete len:341 (-) Transcript_37268:345-1367(-)
MHTFRRYTSCFVNICALYLLADGAAVFELRVCAARRQRKARGEGPAILQDPAPVPRVPRYKDGGELNAAAAEPQKRPPVTPAIAGLGHVQDAPVAIAHVRRHRAVLVEAALHRRLPAPPRVLGRPALAAPALHAVVEHEAAELVLVDGAAFRIADRAPVGLHARHAALAEHARHEDLVCPERGAAVLPLVVRRARLAPEAARQGGLHELGGAEVRDDEVQRVGVALAEHVVPRAGHGRCETRRGGGGGGARAEARHRRRAGQASRRGGLIVLERVAIVAREIHDDVGQLEVHGGLGAVAHAIVVDDLDDVLEQLAGTHVPGRLPREGRRGPIRAAALRCG